MIVRKFRLCVVIVTILLQKLGTVERLSVLTTLSALRWSSGSDTPSGLRKCGKANLTAWLKTFRTKALNRHLMKIETGNIKPTALLWRWVCRVNLKNLQICYIINDDYK